MTYIAVNDLLAGIALDVYSRNGIAKLSEPLSAIIASGSLSRSATAMIRRNDKPGLFFFFRLNVVCVAYIFANYHSVRILNGRIFFQITSNTRLGPLLRIHLCTLYKIIILFMIILISTAISPAGRDWPAVASTNYSAIVTGRIIAP